MMMGPAMVPAPVTVMVPVTGPVLVKVTVPVMVTVMDDGFGSGMVNYIKLS
jgi:hypothetical protein